MKLIRILAGCFLTLSIVGVVGLSVGMDYGDLSVRNLTVSGTTNGVTLPQSAITNLISDLSAKLDTDSLISSTELTYTYGSDSGRYYVSAVPQSKITGLTTSDTANFYGTSTTNISTTNATIAHIYGGTAIDTPRISGSLVVDSPLSTSIPTLYVDAANDRVGIGTASPTDVTLEIMKDGRAYNTTNGHLLLTSTHTTGDQALVLGADKTNNVSHISAAKYQQSWTANLALNPNGGNVGIGTATPGYPLEVTGNAYFSANVSALSYTDRTPYPEDTATAYAAIQSMERLPAGQYKKWDKSHQVNHNKTHEFIKTESGHRDLSATVSCQNEVIKDLIKRIEALEAKVQTLEARQ